MNDQRAVSYEDGENLAKEYNIKFFETSAKQDIGVEKAFVTLATEVKQRLMSDSGNAGGNAAQGGQKLAPPKKDEKKAGGCC